MAKRNRLEQLETFLLGVIEDRRDGRMATFLRGLLRGLSYVYTSLVQLRLWLYRQRIARPHELGCQVISIGNLTVGGTGKTPIVEVFARTLQKAATTPRLAPLAEGLPAAGGTGTLGARFYGPTATSGRGWVRAKTGTLTGVSTLAGRTRTASGGEVVFAFMSNQSKQEWGVRNWLDQMASVVTSCGC